MYKVLLVDDEIQNYQLFQKLVDWEEKGFVIAGTASDGLEALQKYEELEPDLIFMDIQLPLMDGLECIRCIREADKRVKIIIVSAYGDFTYAQKAIRYGVEDFLLKPVSRLLLNQMTDKIAASLAAEAQGKGFPEDGSILSVELSRLLNGETAAGDVKEKLGKRGLAGIVLVAENGLCIPAQRQKELLSEQCGKDGEKVRICAVGTDGKGHALAAFEEGAELEKTAREILCRLEKNIGKVQIYLPDTKNAGLEKSIRSFVHDENYGFYETGGGIYTMGDVPFVEQGLDFEETDSVISEAIAGVQEEKVNALIDKIFERAREQRVHPAILKDALVDLLVKIKFMLRKFDPEGSFDLMRNVRLDTIQAMQDAQMLRMLILTKVHRTFQELRQRFWGNGKNLVFRTNAFVEQHYCEIDFSVQKAADYNNLSKNYFTTLYKEQTGNSFWEYVTRLRMEKARELLLTTDEMSGSIGRMVGYESEYHFSRKFKECTGESPNRYRKNRRN